MGFKVGDKVKIILVNSEDKVDLIGEVKTIASYDVIEDSYKLEGVSTLRISNYGYPYPINTAFKKDELRLATTDELISQVNVNCNKRINKLDKRLYKLEWDIDYAKDSGTSWEKRYLYFTIAYMLVFSILVGLAILL